MYVDASEEVRRSEAWRGYIQPLLEADLRADARAERRVTALWSDMLTARSVEGGYVNVGEPPLRCALHVCCGQQDAVFPPEAIDAWRPLSGGPFATHALRGGHDVLQRRAPELLRRMVGELMPYTQLYAVQWRPLDGVSAEAPPPPRIELSGRVHHIVLSAAPSSPTAAGGGGGGSAASTAGASLLPAVGAADLVALRGEAGLL
eukprot:scaffold26605_cov36-Phaeocystis_antarctica.AAC.1